MYSIFRLSNYNITEQNLSEIILDFLERFYKKFSSGDLYNTLKNPTYQDIRIRFAMLREALKKCGKNSSPEYILNRYKDTLEDIIKTETLLKQLNAIKFSNDIFENHIQQFILCNNLISIYIGYENSILTLYLKYDPNHYYLNDNKQTAYAKFIRGYLKKIEKNYGNNNSVVLAEETRSLLFLKLI